MKSFIVADRRVSPRLGGNRTDDETTTRCDVDVYEMILIAREGLQEKRS